MSTNWCLQVHFALLTQSGACLTGLYVKVEELVFGSGPPRHAALQPATLPPAAPLALSFLHTFLMLKADEKPLFY